MALMNKGYDSDTNQKLVNGKGGVTIMARGQKTVPSTTGAGTSSSCFAVSSPLSRCISLVKDKFAALFDHTVPVSDPSHDSEVFNKALHVAPIRIRFRIPLKIKPPCRALSTARVFPKARIDPIAINGLVAIHDLLNTSQPLLLVRVATVDHSKRPRRWQRHLGSFHEKPLRSRTAKGQQRKR